MFPVILFDGKTQIPENEKVCYLITKNGVYLYKNLNTIRSLTPVESISHLKEPESFAELKIPMIPKELIREATSYFRYVYKTCDSEGGLLIHYFPNLKKFKLHCPVQQVSSGGVHWDNRKEPLPKGAIRIGTIHSHASMSAFHSGTDVNDEKKFDGIHVTIGHMDEKIHSIVASIVVGGTRFVLDENKILKYLEIEVVKNDNNECTIYEDYQSTIPESGHNVNDITKNFTLLNRFINDKIIFNPLIDKDDDYFPEEWKNKFSYEKHEAYGLHDNEFYEYSKYFDHFQEYNWKDWSNDKNCIQSTEHIRPVGNVLEEDKIYPVPKGCLYPNCEYRRMVIDSGEYDLIDDFIKEHYGKHTKDPHDIDLSYDEDNNIVNNVKEEQEENESTD